MKYLTYELYEKVANSIYLNGKEHEDDENVKRAKTIEAEWNKRYSLYLEEFYKLSTRFPKNFLREYNKDLMHDSIVYDIKIERRKRGKQYRYDMTIMLLDYNNDTIVHAITFFDISCLNCNLSLGHQGDSYWLYNEFLSVNDSRLSFEVAILDGSTLYCEFSKLRYKKIRLDK